MPTAKRAGTCEAGQDEPQRSEEFCHELRVDPVRGSPWRWLGRNRPRSARALRPALTEDVEDRKSDHFVEEARHVGWQ
jgi:hypothetical protein